MAKNIEPTLPKEPEEPQVIPAKPVKLSADDFEPGTRFFMIGKMRGALASGATAPKDGEEITGHKDLSLLIKAGCYRSTEPEGKAPKLPTA